MAIGQQIKGLARRARRYWDDLTDAEGRRAQASREEREDAVHQRYGGVRRQDERAARSGPGNPGGQSRPDNPVQAGTPRTPAGRAAGAGGSQGHPGQRG